MTDFISHAQESRFKLLALQLTFVEFRRVSRKITQRLATSTSVRTTKSKLSPVHDVKIHLMRRSRQEVSSKHDVGYKKNRTNEYRAREYTPALLRQKNET